MNDKYITKPKLSINTSTANPQPPITNTVDFEIRIQEFQSCDHMEVRAIIRKIIDSLRNHLDHKIHKIEKDAPLLEKTFKHFNSNLDMLIFLYLNWPAQGRKYIDEKVIQVSEESKENLYRRNANRCFTVPELEPYSGSLVNIDKDRKKPNEDNDDSEEEKETKSNVPTSMKNILKFRRNGMRKQSLKIINFDLNIQNISFKEMEKFTDAEISETLSNFNLGEHCWRQVPIKQKYKLII